MRFFQDMLASLTRGYTLFPNIGKKHVSALSDNPRQAVEAVMSATGEVSSLVYAENLLRVLEGLDDAQLAEELTHIISLHDIDAASLQRAAGEYKQDPSNELLRRITELAEPAWQKLFRHLNATRNGTVRLVKLRQRLLSLIGDHPDLKRLDNSLVQLMRHWFNPGFLVLEPIDWSTPANILEKIIAYEAVHAIGSWDELRARLAPEDRRCFAFFHPAMPDEPLIFVEVALMNETPDRIDNLLDLSREERSALAADTAVFYSISNCQEGLAGISFGNFLIKTVAQELKQEFENLRHFLTLSPVPGLINWMTRHEPVLLERINAASDPRADEVKQLVQQAAIRYFTESTRKDGMPNDPVARFHIGNGAQLEQMNFDGDLSTKGIAQSAGLMVNYRYDLDVVEKNHEEFIATKIIPTSAAIKALSKSVASE